MGSEVILYPKISCILNKQNNFYGYFRTKTKNKIKKRIKNLYESINRNSQ